MNQKLVNTILLSLAFVAMVIGVHRSIAESDIASNYWIYMIGFMLYIVYHYRKKKQTE
ncbi:hypothetical protein [Pontibacter indicus]|uniref:Uncharacterized protein n=1 Tax=Pontibacter indicus TaxID=1317125 RepID=A0A1R3XDN3_9BACT|nr:hypothetical protein [Pontibacter indicus]SIT89485.1 hypothetical protein SAMN05444128_2031 [Pontibacter indicus]